MFSLVLEKEAFEKITAFEYEDFPVWNKIIAGNIDITLNLTEEELEQELNDPESPMTMALQAYQSIRRPNPGKELFDGIQKDAAFLENYPKSAFILNLPEKECQKLGDALGLLVYSSQNLKDEFTQLIIEEDFAESEIVQCHLTGLEGWTKVLKPFEKHKSNSSIFVDRNLFTNTERKNNVGVQNLNVYMDSILPKELKIPYHLFIATELSTKFQRQPRLHKDAVKELIKEISSLRDYEIIVETLFIHSGRPGHKYTHQRRVLKNYYFGKAEHGFSIFHVNDKSKVRSDNDFDLFGVMNSSISRENNVDQKRSTKLLNRLKYIKEDAELKLAELGQNDHHYRLYLGEEESVLITNRLLN